MEYKGSAKTQRRRIGATYSTIPMGLPLLVLAVLAALPAVLSFGGFTASCNGINLSGSTLHANCIN